ncbi:transmembrane protein, putative (DUF1163) [Arabidopsis thaliana]|uniref:Transmembrane protein, putative (DUF1163) n=1 Tax=Arabidopsis thaliana TaxID=3702 RepID=B3H709_ARATH|nr:transmembrane protein, putative (DUF1163) [Arabidopsis thaliana]AED94421.1 transmembrane protein, putative (DUF1163) [Arabidopsis thaliana]|eukprot:NP_001119335.1 transmembrane protein, putative (DUF1163) [Arabidopsis thaliana]
MKKEALVPKLTSELPPFTLKDHPKFVVLVVILFCIAFFIAMTFCGYEQDKEKENYVPNITIPSMDFTVLNITETHLSVKWDLLLRIPRDLPGWYMCLKGDFQLSIIYRGVTIATSSIESLIPRWAQLIRVSSIASEGDMEGVIIKDIMKDIKEKGEIRFRSRLLLPDCRYGTSGKMNYACDEAMLRFEPGSQRNATLFGDHPICRYLR